MTAKLKGRDTHGQEGSFSRNRLLPFGHLIISILKMGKTGLQREMDNFFRKTENEQFSIRRITKGGFSKSRRKLSPEAFLELNDIIWKDFYKEVDFLGYHGHKLLAADDIFGIFLVFKFLGYLKVKKQYESKTSNGYFD